jgi:hypothetical protein
MNIKEMERLKTMEKERKRVETWEHRELMNRFTYHAPKEGQPKKYEAMRAGALKLAELVNVSCPESREKALALNKLDEVVFWANAAIARRG